MIKMETLMMTEIKIISFHWPINIYNWVKTVYIVGDKDGKKEDKP